MEDLVFTVGNEALLVVLKVALPILGAALLVGILVSIFQAVTQIHELTLAFVPKILAVILIGALLGPWMVRVVLDFTRELFWNLPLLFR
ncbi:MAG: flagellar biosynthesis protein FliQ [Candidatus Caldatribacterium sp.]|uniref:flagellar biosynthesis protein FliQ n=1 Tax=Candidatus Caldatribacterium sp. TaxID=2282143 RepID=UPI002994C288|nr:flagellar biosynthesis protein FliQ [Candidatus Caldatribacterium sp.]MCX7730886.1 flagellar biosynthesis protein FliQ [Candidatus Caldatribacterium sp.]MDW8081009.1 flagellar biosynthesis protein FliQ [Candidatus Calescibacterium sp.]